MIWVPASSVLGRSPLLGLHLTLFLMDLHLGGMERGNEGEKERKKKSKKGGKEVGGKEMKMELDVSGPFLSDNNLIRGAPLL